jgi:hypothetical protein
LIHLVQIILTWGIYVFGGMIWKLDT